MEDNDLQSQPGRLGDPVLPGLGIVMGMAVGVFAWGFVEDSVGLGPAGTWLAQGLFYAGCIVVASALDGLIRPDDWPWPNRTKGTMSVAFGVVVIWGTAAAGSAVAGETGFAIGWLSAFVVLCVIEESFRRARRRRL